MPPKSKRENEDQNMEAVIDALTLPSRKKDALTKSCMLMPRCEAADCDWMEQLTLL